MRIAHIALLGALAASCAADDPRACTRRSDCANPDHICLDYICQPFPAPPAQAGGVATGLDAGVDAGSDVAADDSAAEAEVVDPCVGFAASPSRVNLGSGSAGEDLSGRVRLRNGTSQDLTIASIRLDSALWIIDAPAETAFPVSLRAGRSLEVTLRMVTGAGEVSTTMRVAGTCPLAISVTGTTR